MRGFLVVPSFLWLLVVSAWSADWLTDGGDVKRTNWQKDEKIINTKNAKDIKLLWQIKLDNQPRQMHSLLPPLVIGRLNTSTGPKQVVIQAGVSDNLYAIQRAAVKFRTRDRSSRHRLAHDVFPGDHQWNGPGAYPFIDRWL